MSSSAAAPVSTASTYARVGDRLSALTGMLGLEDQRPLIERTFRLLCGESLAYPWGERPPRSASLNVDGTPIQLALDLGGSAPPLQFLAETGAAELSNPRRAAADRRRLAGLARWFGAEAVLPAIEAALDDLTPERASELTTAHGGATWIGVSFAPGRPAAGKMYVNAAWGDEADRWTRLEAFAARAGAVTPWHQLQPRVRERLQPLGVSLRIGVDGRLGGRIYLRGYGESFAYYEALAAGDRFAAALRAWGQTLLGDDYGRPTRSLVYSVAVAEGRLGWPKLELCAHCAFDGDVQAHARVAAAMRRIHIDPAPYAAVVRVLAAGELCRREARMHSYVGLAGAPGAAQATVYLNPCPVIV